MTAGEYIEMNHSDEIQEQVHWNEQQNQKEVATGLPVEAGSQSSSKKAGFTLKINPKDTPS